MDSEAETLDTLAESDQPTGETSVGIVVDRGGVAVVDGRDDGEPYNEQTSQEDDYQNVRRVKKPYCKPTNEEITERVHYVLDMLAGGRYKHEIVRTCKDRYDVSTRTVEQYLSRARSLMVEKTEKPRDEWRFEQLRRYLEIGEDKSHSAVARVRALERIDKILGLEIHMPRHLQISGPDGGPIEHRSEQQVAVVVAGVDLSGRLADVGSRVRGAAVQALLDHVKDAADNGESLPVIDVTPDSVKVSD